MKRPTDRPTTLRGLAKLLGIRHSSLSEAIKSKRITAGVALDARGRIAVTDAAAVAAAWRAVHLPSYAEQLRAEAEPPVRVLVNDGLSPDSFSPRNLTAADIRRHFAEWGHPLFNVFSRQDLLEALGEERLHAMLVARDAEHGDAE